MMSGEIIYISGPISKDPDHASKFKAAAEHLKSKIRGVSIIIPQELPHEAHDAAWESFMKVDLSYMISWATCVVVLEGWKKSRGAIREVMIAKWLKIPVYRIEDLEDVKVPLWLRVKLFLNLI